MSEYRSQNIKEITLNELTNTASCIREELVEAVSIHGGHLSSNLGVVEITLALHRIFDFPKDKLLFDVGHQSYVHKLLSGRSLSTLRTKNGISGFQKRDESEYDCFEAGHSSTSLSAALGMAISRDLNNEDYHIIAFIGDGSIVSGPSFEALNNLAHIGHKVIIILNDNEMSISKPVGGAAKLFSKIRISVGYHNAKTNYQRFLSKTRIGRKLYKMSANMKNKWKRLVIPPTFFDALGLDYLGPVNGHDFEALEKALKRAKKSQNTVIVHCHTIKGKGYSFAEKDENGKWHGVGPFNKETGSQLKEKVTQSWSKYYSSLVLENMKDERLVYINPAMIRGFEAEELFEAYPNRCFDVGIAEEHSVSLASGVSLSGKHPVLAVYSTFLQRAIDQINQDLCRMKLPCTLLVDRLGLVGLDGETHHGIFDEGYLINNPNIIISTPCTMSEAKQVFSLSLKSKIPFVIRYPRGETYENEYFLGEINDYSWRKIKDENNSSLIIGVGVNFAKLASEVIKRELPYDLINALFIKPIDIELIKSLNKYQKIIIYDSYSTRFGFVNYVLSLLLENGYKGEIIVKCIEDNFIKQATIEEQLIDLGLDIDSIIKEL